MSKRTCAYPMWDGSLPPREQLLDGSAYCQEPAQKESSYCPEHHAKCWIKPQRSKDVKKVQWDFRPRQQDGDDGQ